MAGRDPRLVLEADHQKAWLSPNPNTNQKEKNLASSWEKECCMLRELGINEEELKVYSCSIRSPIDRVDELNKDIIDKLNALAAIRRGYFLKAVKKKKGAKKDLKHGLKSMSNLKMEIFEAQRKITNLGGVYEKYPGLFNGPVQV